MVKGGKVLPNWTEGFDKCFFLNRENEIFKENPNIFKLARSAYKKYSIKKKD